MIGDLRSLKVIGNLTPCGTFWVRKEDNKEQEAMLQNISDGIAKTGFLTTLHHHTMITSKHVV